MLANLPSSIIETIAFHLSTSSTSVLSATPPSDLSALLCCNSLIYETLNIELNPHLYAHIFEATFDTRAIRRQQRGGSGHVHVAHLADELTRRWSVLKRFRSRVMTQSEPLSTMVDRHSADEEVLRTDLWTVFIMFTQNDGRNAAMLMHYAHVDAFVLQCVRHGGLLHRHAVEENGGWTVDSEINALLGWIFWFTDVDRIPNESIEQRDEVIEALSPLYVGSFKYSLPHAPISFFYPPSHPPHLRAAKRVQTNVPPAYTQHNSSNPSIHPISSSTNCPPCLITSPSLISTLARSPTTMTPPPSSSSSSSSSPFLLLARPLPIPPIILSYVARQELQFLRWPREPSGVPRGSRAPATREEARRVGWAGPTGEDYLWFLDVRTKRVELGVPSVSNIEGGGGGGGGGGGEDGDEDENDGLSKRWDIDWARLVMCFDPFGQFGGAAAVPRDRFSSRVRVYEPGMLDGVWDGKWLMTPPNVFQELLHATEQDVPLAPRFRPPHIQTPMTFRLKEHHSFAPNPDHNLPYDDTGPGALRAWIPQGIRFVQNGDHLNIYEDIDGAKSKFVGTYETFSPFESHRVRRHRAMKRMRDSGASWYGYSSRDFHNAAGREERREDAMEVDYLETWSGDNDSGYDINEDEERGSRDEGLLFGQKVRDIIITAETEPYFAEAWGLVSFRGRVRPWDGLVVLERMPANGTGRWIFRGYLHGGNTLVGRWRETGTQFDANGWEGAWVVGRRA